MTIHYVAVVCVMGWLASCSARGVAAPADAHDATSPTLDSLSLQSAPAKVHLVRSILQRARYTAIVFFSHSCPCVRVHDERLIQLAREFEQQGVQVLMVDSEFDATIERAQTEARRRRYPFPLLVDEQGGLARALGARYASQAIVLDGSGTVRYAGGIDSDKNFLQDNARPYLRNALRALLHGKAAPAGEHRALGCGLRLR